MANVLTYLSNILNAVYGKDVRQSIHDGIQTINTEVEDTTTRQNNLKSQFDSLTINAGNSNAEIVAGRTSNVTGKTFDTMGHRVDDVDSSLDHIQNLYVNIASPPIPLNKAVKGQDSTTAIQACIDYVTGLGGGTVVIPVGTFIFTTLCVKSNVRLLGNGGILKLKDNTCINVGTSYYLIHNMNGSDWYANVTFENLIVDGNQTNNTLYTVADAITAGGENVKVANCRIFNPPDSGVMFSGAKNGMCADNRIDNARDVGIYSNDGDGTKSYENIISRNRITRCKFGGIALKRINQRVIVENNTIYDCGNGITLEQASTSSDYSTNLEIRNNRLRNIGQSYTTDVTQPISILLRYCKNVICMGNRIENCLLYGIVMQAAEECIVNNNVITVDETATNASIAIHAYDRDSLGCVRNIISNNIIYNKNGYGIYLTNVISGTPESKYNIIKSNNVKSSYRAMRIDAKWINNNISENILNGLGLDLWYTNPTDNIMLNNIYVNGLLSGAPSASNKASLLSYFNTQSGINATNIISFNTTIPSSGTFTKGDLVLNTNKSELGIAGNKYILFGWHRLTTGANHVLNTDWQELRMLTGN